MSCNYYRGKCLFLNGKEDGCKGCPIKKAYNNGVRDMKKDHRPQGEWIKKEDLYSWWYVCNQCGERPLIKEIINGRCLSNFCPNCGALMKGGAE